MATQELEATGSLTHHYRQISNQGNSVVADAALIVEVL
jgi:hypothetical protein